MVILFAASNYFIKGKATGGFSIYLYRVTTALAKMGHTPIVVACGQNSRHYIEEGVEMYIIQCPPNEILMNAPIKCLADCYKELYRSWAVNKKIKEISQERRIDVIQFTSLYGLASCYYGKIPAVMRLSSYTKTYYAKCQTFDSAKVKRRAFYERLAAAHCNAVFAPCQITADDFARDIRRPVSVIETPFINDVTAYDESIYNIRLAGKKYVLFFGVLIVEKGVLVIADILQEFLADYPEYFFVCCGKDMPINGRSAADILRKCTGKFSDRLVYLKELPHEQLYPIIQRADFVIMPSLLDNMPNACLEAMYFERIVIGTEGTSLAQIIDDGISGLLCKPDDADSLLVKMKDAVSMNDSQKAEIGKNARKRIDRLAPEIVVKKLLRFYQYVIEHNRKSVNYKEIASTEGRK